MFTVCGKSFVIVKQRKRCHFQKPTIVVLIFALEFARVMKSSYKKKNGKKKRKKERKKDKYRGFVRLYVSDGFQFCCDLDFDVS